MSDIERDRYGNHGSPAVPRVAGATLAQMAAEVRELNTEKGWRTGSNTFGDYVALLHSEASEMLEAFRDHRLEDATEVVYGNCIPKPEGVGSEMADVLIRLLDMADIYGVDLEAEYRRKMTYNWTRPFRHGGRTLNNEGPLAFGGCGAKEGCEQEGSSS